MHKFKLIVIILLILSPLSAYAAAPTRTYNYVAHTTIDPNQNNTNENNLYSYLQTGVDTYASNSITNDAISSSAAISYSKLNLIGSITNSDIAASAGIIGSKLDLSSPGIIGGTSPNIATFTTLNSTDFTTTNLTGTGTIKLGSTHRGDIFYDNGTSIVRLTPGTSGYFLETQGLSADPLWAQVTQPTSNVIFSFASSCENTGFVSGTTLTTAASSNYTYWTSDPNGNTQTIITSKWVKIPGINTITIWCKIWQRTTSTAKCIVNIGGATGTVSGTGSQTTPEWKSFTIDVSGLSNNTTYDVSIQMGTVTPAGGVPGYLGSIVALGS